MKNKKQWLAHFERGMKSFLDGISNGGYENKGLEVSFDFRNYKVDYGDDEDPWPALGFHRRHH
jgi:hypothetical protein